MPIWHKSNTFAPPKNLIDKIYSDMQVLHNSSGNENAVSYTVHQWGFRPPGVEM